MPSATGRPIAEGAQQYCAPAAARAVVSAGCTTHGICWPSHAQRMMAAPRMAFVGLHHARCMLAVTHQFLAVPRSPGLEKS